MCHITICHITSFVKKPSAFRTKKTSANQRKVYCCCCRGILGQRVKNCKTRDLDVMSIIEFPDQLMKKYVVGEILGLGAFGVTHKAKSRLTDESYALKVIPFKRPYNFSSRADDTLVDDNQPTALELRELHVMQLIDHVNIVKLTAHVVTPPALFLVMELMQGGSLEKRIKPDGMPEEFTKTVFKQVLTGLAYLHQLNHVHRDIKPDNILLSDYSEFPIVKIGDFGLSRHVSERMNSIAGTPAFIAPEMIKLGRSYTKAVDIWSLGVLLYVMLSGVLPQFNKELGDVEYHQCFMNFPFAASYVQTMSKADSAQRPSCDALLRNLWLSENLYSVIEQQLLGLREPDVRAQRLLPIAEDCQQLSIDDDGTPEPLAIVERPVAARNRKQLRFCLQDESRPPLATNQIVVEGSRKPFATFQYQSEAQERKNWLKEKVKPMSAIARLEGYPFEKKN